MRKVDPEDVRTAFVNDARALMEYMDRTRRALEGGPHEKRDISRLASTTFLSLYVSFETFLSDLFLAYLNRDFSQYQASLGNRITQSVSEKFGAWAAGRSPFVSIRNVAVADLEDIIDPNGWNLTFRSAEVIREKACEWLSPAHRGRIQSLTPSDEDLIDTARAIRDFIAHRSLGSKNRMNQQLQIVERHGRNPNLRRGRNAIQDEGVYLKAVFGGQRRIAVYASRLQDIAGRL